MPEVRPFSALRYDPAVAGPLKVLVAPPYDVIDAKARLVYLALSPYNVVHLTLPDSPGEAGEALARWRAQAPGNQLGDLGTEIDDQQTVGISTEIGARFGRPSGAPDIDLQAATRPHVRICIIRRLPSDLEEGG